MTESKSRNELAIEVKAKELTPKELDFVHKYLEIGRIGEAGRLAGFTEASSKSYCSELLKKPKIQDYIFEVKKNMAIRAGWTKDKVIAKLDELYNQSMNEKSFTASLNALKLIGNELGMFKQEKEVLHSHELKIENLLKQVETNQIKNIN